MITLMRIKNQPFIRCNNIQPVKFWAAVRLFLDIGQVQSYFLFDSKNPDLHSELFALQ